MLVVLAKGVEEAAALRDQLRAEGGPAVGASILAAYLIDSLRWATASLLHRQHWQTVALDAHAGWFQPDEEDERQAELRAYLRGD